MLLFNDIATSTFEMKASYSWLNTHYICSWRKKVFKKWTNILLETTYFISSWMKKSVKRNSTLMYPCQHLRRKHHILDWILIISVHEGKKSIKCNSTLMYPHQHLRRKHHILDWLETFVHPLWHWSQSQISRTIPYDPQHFWFHT
jgi:hypothetical protein